MPIDRCASFGTNSYSLASFVLITILVSYIMRFIKDIFLFDLETSGPDLERDVVLQFSGILLDKDNLLQKAQYTTYIRNSLLSETLQTHANTLKVDISVLQKAPKPIDFLKDIAAQFKSEVTLAVPSSSHLFFFRQAYRKQAAVFPYDLSVIDLWTLYYTFGMRIGLRKIPSLHTLLDHFNLHIENPYNAFQRVQLEAEVLRKILRETP